MPTYLLFDKTLQIFSLIRNGEGKQSCSLSFLGSVILPKIEEKDDKIIIPGKYQKVAKDIGQSLQISHPHLTCYLNLATLETEELPENFEYVYWFGKWMKMETPFLNIHTGKL